MKKSVISVNSMIETYVSYGLDEETWEMFYKMRCHNLISNDVWGRFNNTCKGWQFGPDNGLTIIDSENNGKIIYITDENGFYKKVE